MINVSLLKQSEITETVRFALDEDIGTGDLTAALVSDRVATASVVCRQQAVISGRPWFDLCFRLLDESITINWLFDEGAQVQDNDIVCTLEGSSRSILTAERTALNFLQTLSGVATVTREYVNKVAGTGCIILDTRKSLCLCVFVVKITEREFGSESYRKKRT